jgi:hypothetical protein
MFFRFCYIYIKKKKEKKKKKKGVEPSSERLEIGVVRRTSSIIICLESSRTLLLRLSLFLCASTRIKTFSFLDCLPLNRLIHVLSYPLSLSLSFFLSFSLERERESWVSQTTTTLSSPETIGLSHF